jgi:hypothetical protein
MTVMLDGLLLQFYSPAVPVRIAGRGFNSLDGDGLSTKRHRERSRHRHPLKKAGAQL